MDVNGEARASLVERDANRVNPADWTHREFPLGGEKRLPAFQVVCRRSVLSAVRSHGCETHDVEVCGVLVGNVHQDRTGPYLYIQHSIRGEHASNLVAQVTFTSETWTHIHNRMEEYPDQRIVGWYHTHPDFGIFLSPADLFIHENFFALPWQVALVDDPVRQEVGLFVWRRDRAVPETFLVEEDDGSEPLKQATSTAAPTMPDAPVPEPPVARRAQRWITGLSCAVLLAISGIWSRCLQRLGLPAHEPSAETDGGSS